MIVIAAVVMLLPRHDRQAADTNKPDIDSLKFSNTMQWAPELQGLAGKQTLYIMDWQEKISLPNPPTNSSPKTAHELELLLSYKSERTEAKIQQIKDEADFHTTQFDGRLITDYFDEKKFPNTAEFLKESFNDLNIIIMSQKQHFDRVRPSVLEPGLDPVLEVPGHPAYPSGHSTQAHFLAYALGELMPNRKQVLIDEAYQIARNREVAGLHYPSDTEAGKLLARQFLDLALRDPNLGPLLTKAKQEWK